MRSRELRRERDVTQISMWPPYSEKHGFPAVRTGGECGGSQERWVVTLDMGGVVGADIVIGVRSHPPRGTVAACTRVTTYQICLRSTRVGRYIIVLHAGCVHE